MSTAKISKAEAALEAARRGKESVDMKDLEFSKDKILMGKTLSFIIYIHNQFGSVKSAQMSVAALYIEMLNMLQIILM